MSDAARCPACGTPGGAVRFRAPARGTELGVAPEAFRPSSERYGEALAPILGCARCGHGWVRDPAPGEAIGRAYADAEDPVSLREEEGQVETARRGLALIERTIRPGRLLDVGCWTGSFLAAAAERGWDPEGLEPSRWASERARERGLAVTTATLEGAALEDGSFRLVVMADVLEHLEDPLAAARTAARIVEPGGGLFVTVPDAGSPTARLLGRRWWSVLPMHLQYFSRTSLRTLLGRAGLAVRWMRTHPKTFTARYYAERLEGYAPAATRAAVRVLERVGRAGRLVSPDLRDRVAVLAVRA